MTEEQKYQGALYKNKKAKTGPNSTPSAQKEMAHAAYVEDVVDHEGWGAPPHAPSPPPAVGGVNVFDYQVNATPSASTVVLPQTATLPQQPAESTDLVRYEYKPEANDDVDADMMADDEALVQYGSGPIPIGSSAYETPAPKRGRKKADKEVKKDKKRKRLHVDTNDLDMPDADADADAPVLHSGLTGGLNRMMSSRPHAFPPSPDYSGSGGEVVENPATPLKKSKHTKHHKSSRPESGIINGISSMLSSGNAKSTTKSKKRKHASTSPTATKKRHSHHGKRLEGAKGVKMLEYNDEHREGREGKDESGAMVVFKPRADLFLSLISKGPESERGCSVHRALKRFHHVRSDTGHALAKPLEEKELFRSLRMRRNDRGEIVLFCIAESE
jgi:cell growth-regulating nucleolar protein